MLLYLQLLAQTQHSMRRSAFYKATLAVCTATRPNAALCAVARLDNGRIHSAVSAVAYSDAALDVAAWAFYDTTCYSF